MPYNPETESITVISKSYKEVLKQISKLDRRGLRQQLEFLIAKRAKQLNVDVPVKGIDK